MNEIIIESVLFVALIAAFGALFFFVILYFTPVGVRIRQTWNRRLIDSATELVCPTHGPHTGKDLVRLTNGDTLCPQCYKEMLNG